MATIRVRLHSGDEEDWQLLDDTDLGGLVRQLAHPIAPGAWISFPVASEGGDSSLYGFVGLSVSSIAWWHVDGLVDASAAAALWAELEGLGEEPPSSE
jgi:hypothetical protein